MILLLSILQQVSLAFSLTVAQNAESITLHYPRNEGVLWLETCVESEGHGDADKDKYGNTYPWYWYSCWPPTHNADKYELRPETYHVRAHLTVLYNGERRELHTPVMQVRPE